MTIKKFSKFMIIRKNIVNGEKEKKGKKKEARIDKTLQMYDQK